MKRPNTNNYRQAFLSDAPMIDLRAPCEFELGAFPNSVNLPLMTDKERELVGICYKQQGQERAIELGHQLVQGETKLNRVNAWKKFAEENLHNGFLYCFRGGLRSRTSQRWLSEVGIDLPMIEGGYKAMRGFLISETERLVDKSNIYIIAGLTGSAKTELILKQSNAIDLEGLANHRGSSFGKRISPQPSQISFENSLAIQLMKHENEHKPFLLLEDEGRLIGSRSLPLILKDKMDQAPLVMIEENFEFRVEQIFSDYVVKMIVEFEQNFDEQAIEQYRNYLVSSTDKIKKRLGGVGLKEMLVLIERAIECQRIENNISKHKDWIVYLLEKYYDPMYGFQIAKKKNRIRFTGSTKDVESYIEAL